MSKNIVIFSDGTGQAGGVRPDQNQSNIYKLYRASRTGPDSSIDPGEQIAFYDAGVGTEDDEGNIPLSPVRWFRKTWSGATGTGISRNIADCYEAILKHYEPGDRVFLFGFSRGAYTARCVGGVMALCGIPTQAADGTPLPRFGKALRRIANEAVADVYEHVSGSEEKKYVSERLEKARRFRAKYGSNDIDGQQANVVPYFVGVFDTVAALGAPLPRMVLMLLGLGVFAMLMAALVAGMISFLPWFTFMPAFLTVSSLIAAAVGSGYLHRSLKTIHDFPNEGDVSRHLAAWRFRFYDYSLNKRVRFARHALAIDETRKDFARVAWATVDDRPDRENEPEWLRQVWFAGNHSDVGGSYAEDESRLADVSLHWMLEQVAELPHLLKVESTKLHLFPNPAGMQHCEVERLRESYPQWIPTWMRHFWEEEPRKVPTDAPLHSSVLARCALPGTLHYGQLRAYRPRNLAQHTALNEFFPANSQPDHS